MALTELYDGEIISADIVTAVGATAAANLLTIVSSNGQRVLIFKDN